MSETEKKPIGQGVKLALEMGPLVVFFLANTYGEQLAEAYPLLLQLGGKIFIGTAFFMVAMAISLSLTWMLERRIAVMPLVTAVMVFVFGGLTLYLQDETFIKVKPTIVNILFGSTILIALYVFKMPLMKLLFDGPFRLDDEGWTKLSFRWGCYFLFLALVNEIVWRNFSNDFWVNFKVWATMPMTLIFMMFQYPVMVRHGIEEEAGEHES
ncbi:MAG: septation protein A [Rhizobiaceae bacterium]|jgi:intracellular septation protein|nr:septation protein A [Rhizobiaceae bacterium]